MGIEIARSREIEGQLVQDMEKDRAAVKLLLLGAGESGKSTIFKQMRILYGQGFSEPDRISYAPVVHANALSSARTLLQLATAWRVQLGPAAREAAAFVQSLPEDVGAVVFDKRLASYIAALWADSGIQSVFAQRSRFQLIDSAG